ncbi:hypothetical protein SPFM15_00050 [Salmonella phage SPFM15]|nr:hypothetical protein SPFM5_00045 [Salmonella phage SPFM5]VFR13674.1 hypothetical protein SPFM15_00050 [Salmonella phage SPFM15]
MKKLGIDDGTIAHWDWLPNLIEMIAEHIDPDLRARIPLKHYYMMQGRKIFPNKLFILSVDGTSLGNVFAEISYKPGSFTPVTESRFIHALVDGTDCIRLGRNLKAEIYGGTFDIMRQAVNTWPDIEKLRALYLRILDYLMREIDNRTLVMDPGEYFVTPHGPFRTLEGYYHNIYSQGRTEIGRMASNFYARMGYQSTLVDITPSTDGLNHFVLRPILPPEEKEAFVRYLLRDALAAAFGFTLPASAETTYPDEGKFLRSALERLRVDGASVQSASTLVQSYFAL